MSIGVRVAGITFSGTAQQIATDTDAVVLVGPSNAGKSRALREIAALAREDADTVVVTTLPFNPVLAVAGRPVSPRRGRV